MQFATIKMVRIMMIGGLLLFINKQTKKHNKESFSSTAAFKCRSALCWHRVELFYFTVYYFIYAITYMHLN